MKHFRLLFTVFCILYSVSHAQYPIRNYVSLQDNTTHLYGASGGFLIKQLLPNGSGARFTSFAAYRDSSIFYAAGSEKLRIAGTALTASDDILPGATAAYDFGATGTRWRNLWLSGSATIGAVAGTAAQLSLKGNLHIEATGNSNQLRLQHDGTDAYVNASSGQLRLQLAGSSKAFLSATWLSLVDDLAVNGGDIAINSAAASQRQLSFQTNLLRRFVIVGANSTAESGSNTGSNFNIARYNDAGTFVENALSITRSDGTVSIGQNLIASGTGTSSFNRDLRMFPTSGGTHNGNILISYSDQYPTVLWRSGSTNKAQIIGDVSGGNITIDRVGGSFTIRDAINGGNSDFIVANGGNATLRGNLNVNGGVITVAGSAGTNTVALGVVNTIVRNTVTGETTFITNNSNLVFSPTNGNVIVNSDLAVNGGDITTTSTTLRLTAGGGGVLRFLGDVAISEILAENNHSRWGNRRDDAIQENIDIGVYTNGTTWNSRLLLNSTGGTVAGDLGVNGGDITSGATSFNLLNSTVQTLNFGGASTATTISAATGNTTVRNNTYIGDQKNFGSTSFVSGFTGAGYQSFYKDSEYWFETDNVNIRGTLSAYELLIQQIRAANGSIYVTAAQKVDTVIDATAGVEVVDMEDPGNNNAAYFAEGDIMLTQRARIDDPDVLIKRIVRVVDSTSGKRVWLTSAAGGPADTGIIEDGDEFVRIGSETDAARRGSVYLTADDTEAPYIDVVDDVASWADFRSVSKNKVRLGNLTGVTDADFGGALSGYGLYTTQGYFKGNIHVKSGVSQALQNNAIQIGNITGAANSAIKITNTGTASTSGLFAYDTDGDTLFSVNFSGSGRFIGAHFANDDMWAGNSSFSSAATTFQLNNFSAMPRLAMGDSTAGITIANAEPGIIMQGDGQLKAYTDASNYIRKTTSALDIAATDFELASGNLGLSGNAASSYIKIGTLADATTTATTNSGFRADNSGNVLIKGNVSGADYVKITSGGGIDINASVFNLATSALVLNSSTPKIALGASASSISLTAGTGMYANGSGHFKAGTGDLDATPTGTGISWDGTTFRIVQNGNIGLSVTSSAATLFGWEATTTYLRNSGNQLALVGGVSPRLTVDGDGTASSSGDNRVSMFYTTGGATWGLVGLSGGDAIFQLGSTNQIAGWNFTNSQFSNNNAVLNSSGYLALGSGNDIARLDAQDATYRLWIGNATAGSAPFRITKAGAMTATSGSIGGFTLSSTALTGGLIRTAESGQRVEIDTDGLIFYQSSKFGGSNSLSFARGSEEVMVTQGLDGFNLGLPSAYLIEVPNTNWTSGPYFVIKFVDGGTTKYRYIDLSGTDATWQYSTSSPY